MFYSVCGMLICVTTSGFSQYVLASLHEPGCDTYQPSTHIAVKHDNTRSTQSAMSMSSIYNPNFVREAKIKELCFTTSHLVAYNSNSTIFGYINSAQYSGGSRISRLGGMRSHWGGAHFGKNVCENERIRSC